MFEPRDLLQLRKHGLDPDDARRQLERLTGPPPRARLERPCTVGDGIECLDDAEFARALEAHAAVAAEGRVSCFVPASGAATRMVASLDAARRDALREIASDLDGPDLASRPKGLVPFHVYDDGVRTAFEEHLVETVSLARDAGGRCRLELTVSAEHLDAFRAALDAAPDRVAALRGVRLDVELSCQSPSTDTLALGDDRRPLRDDAGALVLRPGGHGALLANLARSGGDLVAIRNVDNVQREERARREWRRALVGRLATLQRELFDAVHALRRSPGDPAALVAATRLARRYGLIAEGRPTDRDAVLHALDRPVRVCGVVRNTGEPGGGPFWARDEQGRATPQIVEGAQVDRDDAGQRAIAAAATHFNPVDLVCALRDPAGRLHPLERFVDPTQSIVTRKSTAGAEVTVLERPGLWNGAMAGWLTCFVEIPLETFTPVKTFADLLRPEHQPPPGSG